MVLLAGIYCPEGYNNAAEISDPGAGKKGCDPAKFRYSWPVNAGRSREMKAAVVVIFVWEEKFQGDFYGN